MNTINDLVSNLTPNQLSRILCGENGILPLDKGNYGSIVNVINLGGGLYEFNVAELCGEPIDGVDLFEYKIKRVAVQILLEEEGSFRVVVWNEEFIR